MTFDSKKFIALAIVLCAAGIFSYTFLHAAVYTANPDDLDSGIAPAGMPAALLSDAATSSAEAGVPVRLRIPKIGVDANVVDVGLGKTGNMAVPYTFTDVGWYRYGPKPGQVGSAVIDGHVDNGLGTPAVFINLTRLEPGDDLYIDTKAGETLHFKVEETAAYAVADVPLQKVFNRNDMPRLTLITCEGTWEPGQKMYDERRVVYAVLQSS
ncbi:MAG TPA: class F sortase [Candidatus Paceibacterota bacterium]|nr:class F sortase [Candidatus Paceibacterota bacterium]